MYQKNNILNTSDCHEHQLIGRFRVYEKYNTSVYFNRVNGKNDQNPSL